NTEKERALKRTESAQFKGRLNEMLNENKQLEQGMKEILQAIQNTQKKTPTSTGVSIPGETRQCTVRSPTVSGPTLNLCSIAFTQSLHLRTQVDPLTGPNEELRQEMKTASEEAANNLYQLTKANEKIAHLESEVESMSKSAGISIPYKSLALPEEMTPTSAEVINALNEYTIQLLQVCVCVCVCVYHIITETRCNRFSVIRHQQRLLYKEYQRYEGERQTDFTQMEAAVTKRIGYLQRFKCLKFLDGSVCASELERYRNLLQKTITFTLQSFQKENLSLHERINSINKELEISKEKLHTLEQAWENISTTGKRHSAKALANSEIVSVSRRITTLEMKELNERQWAEHAQMMYEHLRNSLKQVEKSNFELETKFAEVDLIYLLYHIASIQNIATI
uniref:Uncharacterized protein n=1 Tax=Cyprinus carpio TaxID=7962 RepID=A0A8C1UDR0_CYPCA